MSVDLTPVWDWVRLREAARKRKDAGKPPPYTNDEVIARQRFCNVRREDDRVTVWVRENIREKFRGHHNLWFMLAIARWINWPDTLAELIASRDCWPADRRFSPARLGHILRERAARGEKVFTGAYTINAPPTKGADKPTYVAETVLGAAWDDRARIVAGLNDTPSLEATHRALKRYRGWGNFMAYQVVVDMRFTPLLDGAYDVAQWAAAGPGTVRGLNRTHGRPVTHRIDQRRALDEMRHVYSQLFKQTRARADFSDVPNILCETDKWLRVREGGQTRATYVPGRGW